MTMLIMSLLVIRFSYKGFLFYLQVQRTHTLSDETTLMRQKSHSIFFEVSHEEKVQDYIEMGDNNEMSVQQCNPSNNHQNRDMV